MLEGDKCFELLKTIKLPEVVLAHKDRRSFLTYPIGLANKDFALPLTFNSAPILTNLNVLSDALLGRRSHNESLMGLNILTLFQLDRANAVKWVEIWKVNAI